MAEDQAEQAEHQAEQTEHERPLCPVCWSPFTPTGRQIYCTDTCRKTAWTRRRPNTNLPITRSAVLHNVSDGSAETCACPLCGGLGLLSNHPEPTEPPNR